ncbi:MAG: TonB-dependent receptor [Candidatus Didemnitutus sp.]|nr:TonB-dependent receptor [Candidatus Didemnitutus sp.]
MSNSIAASLRRSLLLAAGFAPALLALAQDAAPTKIDDYLVTATRTPAAANTLGSAIDSISAAELARQQLTGLRSALAGVAGAPAFASGGAGSSTSLFLRGTNSNQTLFIVDGIRFNDPNTDYAVALGGACVTGCDSLEIAHGPQSTLYGGEAVGGVVSLRAQRGAGPLSGSVSAEAGSFGTIQGAVKAQRGDAKNAFSFSALGGHTDNDRANNDFDSATYVLRVDHRVSDAVAVGATWRGFHGVYGSPGTRFTNDPDNQDYESNQLATVFADFTPSPTLTSRAVLGGQDRRFVSENPRAGSATQITVVKNRRAVLDWQATYTGAEKQRVTGGVTAEANHTVNTGFGAINRHQQLFAVFVQDEINPVENVYLTAGLRSDDSDTFGRATTGRVTAAWLVAQQRVKFRASYGTGFRAPSFLDLYGQSAFYVGNPNLAPEKARGWDAGADFYLPQNRGTLSATWFDTRLTNLITFDFVAFPSTVKNVERARTRGVELSGKFTLPGTSATEVRFAYTYLEADNLTQHTRLLRRPRHSGSADLWRDFGGGFSVGAGVAFAAQREDVHAATFATIDAEDYTVARLYAAWQATNTLTVKARVENLLNEHYEEVHGYPQPGAGVFAGLEWRF